MKYIIKIFLAVFILSTTLFAKDVATVTAINGHAFVQRDGTKKEIFLGDKLQEKDKILTSEKTKVQIIFEDETVITLGKNSDFSISEYLFEDKKTVARFTMLRGAMRTITGKIGKIAPQKFSVTTKTSTIGIRGTNFTVIVGDDGSQNVFCTFGAISVQVKGIGKKYVVRQGFYSHITADGKVKIKPFTPKQLQDMKKNSFKHAKKTQKATKEDGFEISDSEDPKDDLSQDDLIIKDITEQAREGVQQDVVTNVVDKGFTLNYDDDYLGLLSVDMGYRQDDTSIVNSGYIEFKGSDSMRYILAPTNEFSQKIDTQFYDVLTEDTVTDVDMAPETNYFRSVPNVVSDDYIAWGEWAIKYDETSESNTYSIEEHGLWVFGIPTDSAVVDAMQGEFVYNGGFKAYDCGNNGELVEGTARMYVDFGDDKVELLFEHGDDKALFDVDPQMDGNSFIVKQDTDNGGDGIAIGKFYGPNAEVVGGEFSISHNSEIDAKGVYQLGNKTPYSGQEE